MLEALRCTPSAAAEPDSEAVREVVANCIEFVALPGKTEKLRAIPLTVSKLSRNSEDFSGCILLFSEQEERLVTVITLWAGRGWSKQGNEISARLKMLLEPSVDRWLRTRRFVTFVSVPEHFQSRSAKPDDL